MGVQDGAVLSRFLDPDQSLRCPDRGYRPEVGVGKWTTLPG